MKYIVSRKVIVLILSLFVVFPMGAANDQRSIIEQILDSNQPTYLGCSPGDSLYSSLLKKTYRVKGSKIGWSIHFDKDQISNRIYTATIQLKFGAKKKIIQNLGLCNSERIVYCNSFNEVEAYYYKNFVISFQDINSRVIVSCYDYCKGIDSYDEFTKIHLISFKPNFLINDMYGRSNLFFTCSKHSTKKTINFFFATYNTRWMFADDAKILLDNKNVVDIKLLRQEETGNLGEDFLCHEYCQGEVSLDDAKTILAQKEPCIKIYGDNYSKEFFLNPAVLSSLRIALESYEN